MYCPKCGNKVVTNNGYCVRCGNSLDLTFVNNNNTVSNQSSNLDYVKLDSSNYKVKSIKRTFIITNLIIYILLVIVLFIRFISRLDFPSTFYFLISASILYFYLICYQKLLIKANLPWWGLFIPIYNFYLVCKLSFGNGLYMFIPILLLCFIIFNTMFFKNNPNIGANINLIVILILYLFPIIQMFCLGKKFGRSGIITILFGFIIIPTTAFSNKYDYLG